MALSLRDEDARRVVQAQWNIDEKSQIAPATALVFDTLYREGEWVDAGHPVVELLPPFDIEVRAFVPETKIGTIHPGDRAQVFVDGVAEPFSATLALHFSAGRVHAPGDL